MQPCSPHEHPEAFPDGPLHGAAVWRISVAAQEMTFWQDGQCLASTPVSTSGRGLGNEPGSLRTPPGWHRAAEIIGRGAQPGQPFVSRKPAGPPLPAWTHGKGDAILSRIVVLDGLEPSRNGNSRARYIYLHGTHQEERLGTPCSHGCVRVGNLALIRWIELLGDRPLLVWIG